MAKWKYELPNGSRIRELIDDEDDIKQLVEELKKAYEYVSNALGIDLDDIAELATVEEALELETFEEEDVNYLLEDLYDFCDQERVWIGF